MAQIEDPVTGSFNRGHDSRQIRSEIDRTRASLDETFDALEQKLTPGQLLEEGWHLLRGGSTAGASKLWQVAKEHPLPAAVIGLGIGWLLLDSSRGDRSFRFDRFRSHDDDSFRYGEGYSGSTAYARTAYGTDFEDESEGRLSSAAHKAKDFVSDAAGTAKDKVSHLAGDAKETLSEAKDRVGNLAGRAKHKVSDLGSEARYKARSAKTGFWELLEENPMAVGAATLALGVIAGLSIPSTRKEDELMGETRDRLFEEVKEAGQEALDKSKQVAGAVVEKVKDEAESQGLTPDNLAEKVRTVAKEAKNTVKEEAKKQNLTGKAEAKPEAKAEAQPEFAKR